MGAGQNGARKRETRKGERQGAPSLPPSSLPRALRPFLPSLLPSACYAGYWPRPTHTCVCRFGFEQMAWESIYVMCDYGHSGNKLRLYNVFRLLCLENLS